MASIDGEAYEVIGVAKEMGSAFGQSQDSFVYIPIQTWRKVYGSNTSMNIMLASVTERTREIGVRKSLGATRRDVLLQFLVESGVMATIGGVIGVMLAAVISFVVGRLTPFPMDLPIGWAVTGVLVAAGVGIFFGVYPAYKASKLNPIEALRFEA